MNTYQVAITTGEKRFFLEISDAKNPLEAKEYALNVFLNDFPKYREQAKVEFILS